MFRAKVQRAARARNRVTSGEVDVLLDFYAPLDHATYFYSSDHLRRIGPEFNAISWHSFGIEKDGQVSVPKVHFKDGSRRVCVDSHDYVKSADVIAYPVVSAVVFGHGEPGPSSLRHGRERIGIELDAEPPYCVDLFILPNGISGGDYLGYDASIYLFTADNGIFMPALGHADERCRYRDKQFGVLTFAEVNGWTCFVRLTDPPNYARHLASDFGVISFDLRTVVSSLLDRRIIYLTDDPNVVHETTFRQRLRATPR